MPITRTPMVDDDGSGTTGTIINNAWKTEFYNQIDAALAPAWQTFPYSAGNFTVNPAAGNAWTVTAGNVISNSYVVMGKVLFWVLGLQGTTLTGAPTSLRVTMPGFTIGQTTRNVYQAGNVFSIWTATAGNNYVDFFATITGNPWAAGTILLYSTMFIPIP